MSPFISHWYGEKQLATVDFRGNSTPPLSSPAFQWETIIQVLEKKTTDGAVGELDADSVEMTPFAEESQWELEERGAIPKSASMA